MENANLQNLYMDNETSPSLNIDLQLLYSEINNLDDNMLKIMNNKIINPYQCKINLLKYLLQNGTELITLKNKTEIMRFFNKISPLSNFYDMGSFTWSFEDLIVKNDNYLLVKNSAVKENLTDDFYNNYINPIKKILINSDINFNYEEFKTARFYKSVDIVFAIKISK